MPELEPVCVKEKPPKTGDEGLKLPGQAPPAAIDRIADNGVTKRGQVHPDLVRAPGFRMNAQQGTGTDVFHQLVLGDSRPPPPGPHGDLLAINGIPAKRRVDGSLGLCDLSIDEREVLLPNLPVLELPAERTRCRLRAGDNHHPACLFVESVNNARAHRVSRLDPAPPMQDGVHQRPRLPSCAGVANQSGRFVDDREIFVFVYHMQWYRLRLRQIRRLCRFGRDYFVSGMQKLACFRTAAVEQDISAPDPGLNLRTAARGQFEREKPVQA